MESLTFSFQVLGVEFVKSSTLFLFDAEISDLPSYLRIGCVEIAEHADECFNYGEFQQLMPLFHQLKPALVGSHLILDIYKMVDREFDSFLKGKLLPLFDCCGSYKFSFKCNPKEISAFVASLLQLPSIAASVGIEFDVKHRPKKRSEANNAAALPIEAISNWLHRSTIKKIGEKRYFRFQFSNIENMSEMVEHLKKVGSRNFLFLHCILSAEDLERIF